MLQCDENNSNPCPIYTEFKVCCFEFVICDVRLVQSPVWEAFSTSVRYRFPGYVFTRFKAKCFELLLLDAVWVRSPVDGNFRPVYGICAI
jgi:hypothetical protein